MHVFVTGGSGFIGSAVVPELLGAGHSVVGLARSDASAARLESAGATVLRGELADLDVLRGGAREADGTIHLGFVHDFANFAAAGATDAAAIGAMAEALEGTGKALVTASGVLGLPAGRLATERDVPAGAYRATALGAVERGVRAVELRLSPTVHGPGDGGFVPALIGIARARGTAAHIGDGANSWPAVHRLDAARLFRLAVESAPAGSVLHGVGEEGIPTRQIAEVIGRHLGLAVTSVAPGEAAQEHFGWMAPFFAMDVRASHAITTELLGWEPTQPGLLADLEEGSYFAARG